jgi:hypothetical protein
MDGKFLMVEDYLEVKPQMRQTVAELAECTAKKISLGQFYFFLSSGEALIRNLMLGMSLSSNMGGTSTVGYLADTFGFIARTAISTITWCRNTFLCIGAFCKGGFNRSILDGSRWIYSTLCLSWKQVLSCH